MPPAADPRDAPPDDTDSALLARVATGEAGAVNTMVARKLPRLLALAQRLLGSRGEAEEVAQETFVRLWQQAPRWRSGQARFDTWLHAVALNLCRDRLRGRREETRDALPDAADPAPGPAERLAGRQQGERVGAALAALPPRQREALVLHYYQELPQAEAAALMGVSVDALESLLARGRRALRAQLTEDLR